MRKFGWLAICVVLAGCAQEGPGVGNIAPDFTAQMIAGKKNINLSDYKGKVVLLDFWATYCGPCKMSMPIIAKLLEDNKAKGFEVISVSAEAYEKVAPFAMHAPISLPFCVDTTALATTRYQVDALPTTILIDRSGKIVFRETGLGPETAKKLQDAISASI
jgi:cytochrome c biogenesis protein CcmG, thiol:disulfide interchange protein DsbE